MEDSLVITATKLTVQFSEDIDLPIQFRKKKNKKDKKSKEDSLLTQRFIQRKNDWLNLITVMLSKLESAQAWRFINSTPILQSDISSVVYNQDFIDFTNYFILRRDIEKCESNEIGGLAWLHTALQREVEKNIVPIKEESISIEESNNKIQKGLFD